MKIYDFGKKIYEFGINRPEAKIMAWLCGRKHHLELYL